MKNHGWVNASNMWRQNLRIANETRYSQITERMDPKHLASVPILGICDEYSSFGVRQLARDQSGDRCGDAFQTIWCSSPAVARTRAGGFCASWTPSVLTELPTERWFVGVIHN